MRYLQQVKKRKEKRIGFKHQPKLVAPLDMTEQLKEQWDQLTQQGKHKALGSMI